MTTPTFTKWEVREWLVARVAEILRRSPEDVPAGAAFSELGLSSLQAVELATAMEDWTGREIPPTVVYDCPTIEDAADYLIRLAS
ncbi:MAG: acyl carrier protein [Actinomadura rubrobrunea]|nr:acyl carrier protein [Actinomadura rubrobrunea]